MPLTKLQFRPGLVQDLTSYSNEGGWRDGDKVRFRLGYPEKIGGWAKYTAAKFLGSCRALHNWITLNGSNFLGLGTHLKYYIEEGGTFNDITPLRTGSPTNAGVITFSAVTSSPFSTTITVTHVNHGAVSGDFVTFSSVASLGGNINANVLNHEYSINQVLTASSYEITAKDLNGTIITSSGSDTGNGGSNTVGNYQINVGLNSTVGGTGWGAGLYGGRTSAPLQTTVNEGGTLSASDTTITVTSSTGIVTGDFVMIDNELILVGGISSNDLTSCTRGHSGTAAATHANGSLVLLAKGNANASDDFFGWGIAASGGLTTTTQIRLWSHDNFGEDLLINPRDSGVFYWDKTSGVGSRAVELSTISGTKRSVPTVCKQIMVSDRDRHVLAFGADGLGSSSATQGNGVQDPLLIRFSSQENPIDWYPVTTNTAGDLRLGSGSTFVRALETKREILVWTDTSLTSMRFIGPPFTFGLQQLASNITIAGPNAAVATEDFVFWMGDDNFYVYAGQTAQLPCTVKDKVFNDINLEQNDKIYGGVNSEFSEVFWFYASAGSQVNNRYVVYNYLEKLWYYGILSRTAWLDRGTRTFPLATDNDGYLYNQEFGHDDDGSPMASYIESSVMDIGDGDRFAFISKVLPDLSFSGSTSISNPQATFTIKARDNPGEDFSSTDSGVATRTQSSPVEEFTKQLNLRARGRSFALRIESSASGSKWRLGSPRVDLRQDGRR